MVHPLVVIIQSLSPVQVFATPWTTESQTSLSLTISLRLLKLMLIESVMPYSHLILCHPLLLLPLVFSSIRVFSNESALYIRWPKYWSFSFSASPSNEYSRLSSFKIDWFDLLAVQENLVQADSLSSEPPGKPNTYMYLFFFPWVAQLVKNPPAM